jgi:hypothetical protein
MALDGSEAEGSIDPSAPRHAQPMSSRRGDIGISRAMLEPRPRNQRRRSPGAALQDRS